tara:strand:- start:113 stop:487 length:375 start_codon:yes stop_codon:yes gene_type:complete
MTEQQQNKCDMTLMREGEKDCGCHNRYLTENGVCNEPIVMIVKATKGNITKTFHFCAKTFIESTQAQMVKEIPCIEDLQPLLNVVPDENFLHGVNNYKHLTDEECRSYIFCEGDTGYNIEYINV